MDGHTGFIHEVLKREYLAAHMDPTQIEYYLCGPLPMFRPAICQAIRAMRVASRRHIPIIPEHGGERAVCLVRCAVKRHLPMDCCPEMNCTVEAINPQSAGQAR